MKKLTYIFALSALIPAFASAATLSLSPASQSANPGQTFTVNVMLDTQGQAIDGVDLTYLRYNPALLQVVSVTPGSLMPLTLSNSFATAGQIQFSQVTTGGTRYTGQGVLAAITFKALAGGQASVAFDHVQGNTRDTNVAGNQTDLLTTVTNGSYGVSGAPPVATPTPPSTTPPVVPPGFTYRFTRGFYVGSKHEEVRQLQMFLNNFGFTVSAQAEGSKGQETTFFGVLTRNALARFQETHMPEVAVADRGYFGPKSRAKINAINGLQQASSSSQNPTVQDLLQQIQQLQSQLDALQGR